MRIPLTKFGWPQVVVFPVALIIAMIVCLLAGLVFLPLWAFCVIETILAGLLIWIFTFFRDPYRPVSTDSNLLLAPADGHVTDIELVKLDARYSMPDTRCGVVDALTGIEYRESSIEYIRIGIFLSIFDPHINRAPCNVKVEKITYKKGRHKNAMSLESGRVNESNDLALLRIEAPNDRLIVRQISGAIARRIVCTCRLGQKLSGGQKFGMIKFGSRTELYVPARPSSCVVRVPCREKENTQYEVKLLVKTGDRVKAGLTPLVKYEIRDPSDVRNSRMRQDGQKKKISNRASDGSRETRDAQIKN